MEAQTYNSGLGDQVLETSPKSLASSVLANIFGQNGYTKTDEVFDPQDDQESTQPSDLARDILKRFDSRKENGRC